MAAIFPRRWNRHNDLLNIHRAQALLHLTDRPLHFHAMDSFSQLARVVVKKALYTVSAVRIALELIQQLNAERKAIKNRMRGIVPPEKLTKKQRQIWEYMKIYPDETNYSTIAKGAKVTRHTVAKHYEMIQKMLGIQKTAPHPLLDCQTVPLMV